MLDKRLTKEKKTKKTIKERIDSKVFKIGYDKKITMVQGDTGVIRMRISNYELSQGDEVRFAIVNKANPSILLCQHSDKKIVLEKQVTVFENDGSARIVIYPYDTEYLQPGKYLYEIQVKTIDGRVDTVVPLTSFTLMDGSIQGEYSQTIPSNPETTLSEIEFRCKRLERETIPELENRITNVENEITNVENEIDSVSSSLDNMGCYLTPEMFGAKGDGITDDTQAFNELIYEAKVLDKSIRLSQNYYITEPLIIDFGINMSGNGSDRSSIITDQNISVLDFSNNNAKNGVYLSNFAITGSRAQQQIGLDLSYITNGSHIENLKISDVGIAIKIRKTWYTSFNNIRISSCNVTGIDICSVDGSSQVNNITFTSVNINQSEQCVTAENEQLASAVNFIGCSFETSNKTACKFVKFRGLSLIGCYFESNMNSATVLTYNNPIDLYIGGSGVNTTYSVIGCFFSRKNNFAESNNKVSIYCTANTNGVIQTNFFKCSTSSYIDYNVYSESSIPVELIKNNQDGTAKNEYHGALRRNILAFKEVNLSSASNSTVYFSNTLNNTRMYISFIPTIDFTSSTATTLRIFNGSTNATLQNVSLGGVTEFITGVEVEGVTNGIINTTSKLLKISTNQSSSGTLNGYLTVYTIDNITK